MPRSVNYEFTDGQYCDWIFRDTQIIDLVDAEWAADSLSDDDLTIDTEEPRTQEDVDASNVYPRENSAKSRRPKLQWKELDLEHFLQESKKPWKRSKSLKS